MKIKTFTKKKFFLSQSNIKNFQTFHLETMEKRDVQDLVLFGNQSSYPRVVRKKLEWKI